MSDKTASIARKPANSTRLKKLVAAVCSQYKNATIETQANSTNEVVKASEIYSRKIDRHRTISLATDYKKALALPKTILTRSPLKVRHKILDASPHQTAVNPYTLTNLRGLLSPAKIREKPPSLNRTEIDQKLIILTAYPTKKAEGNNNKQEGGKSIPVSPKRDLDKCSRKYTEATGLQRNVRISKASMFRRPINDEQRRITPLPDIHSVKPVEKCDTKAKEETGIRRNFPFLRIEAILKDKSKWGNTQVMETQKGETRRRISVNITLDTTLKPSENCGYDMSSSEESFEAFL